MTAMNEPVLRAGRDSDATGFITLIGACWSEYPSIVFDVEAEVPELHALASYYAAKGGALWAAEHNATIIGMIGTVPHGGNTWEIVRLYVAREWRGAGLAQTLLQTAENHARTRGASRFLLWSDTRFERAHRFYEKHGYLRTGDIRRLHDLSNSREFGFAKT